MGVYMAYNSPATPLISIRGVSRSFDGGRTFAVWGLDLEVQQEEVLAIVGESGSGKTTTIKMVNRLVEPSSGSIFLDGEDTSQMDTVELRRRIGYVLQEVGLFPHRNVFENVATIPRLKGWAPDLIHNRVEELLTLVGLPCEDFCRRMPSELSGGQKQRVGFARALAGRPAILLMDEPFGALDPITRDSLQREFLKLRRDLRLTAILVTHDMMEALLMADRIAIMKDGMLLEEGTPGTLLHGCASAYTSMLLGTPRRQAEAVARLGAGGDR